MSDGLSKLDNLTAIAIDSAEGYETAAERATSPDLVRILKEQATKRRQTVEDLNTEITRLGGDRRTKGSSKGSAHQLWTKVTDAFSKGDEEAAERVEEGEDYIEKQFREALNDDDFDAETREVLKRAHSQISEGEKLTDRLEKKYD